MVTPFAEGSLLRKAARARPLGINELGDAGILVLAPHPDDESLGCGGAIAAAVAAGKRVVVAAVTDGRRSHPRSRRYPGDAIARLRRQELEAAVHCLGDGAVSLVWLGYPDQQAPRDTNTLERAVEQLTLATDFAALDTIWTSWELDPHVDHVATAALAFRLVARLPWIGLWRYPVWGRFIELPGSQPEDPVGIFECKAQRRRKRRAMAAHRSQMTGLIDDDPEGFVMPIAMQAHFLEAPEIFIAGPRRH